MPIVATINKWERSVIATDCEVVTLLVVLVGKVAVASGPDKAVRSDS